MRAIFESPPIKMKAIVVLLTLYLASVQADEAALCKLGFKEDFTKNQPLVLKPIPGTDNYEFENSLTYQNGQNVILACPGNNFEHENEKKVLKVTCVGDKEFRLEKKNETFDNLQCQNLPESELRSSGKCLGNVYNAYTIGFQIEGKFVKLIDLCFDNVLKNPLYEKHTISSGLKEVQSGFDRKPFVQDGLIYSDSNVDLETVYRKKSQSDLFSQIGTVSDREKITIAIDFQSSTPNCFLAKGHLAPMSDFGFGALQIGTFHYANVAPQWQSFNGGNWKRLEMAVRKWAVDSQSELTVYTGTHGTYKYGGRDVYLTENKEGKPIVPVPLVFWKVVYDEKKKEAVTFVGLNDINGDVNDNPAKRICQSLCDQIKWVNFEAVPEKGLMYCCTLSDLLETVKTMPRLGPVDLLIGTAPKAMPKRRWSFKKKPESGQGESDTDLPETKQPLGRSKSDTNLLEKKQPSPKGNTVLNLLGKKLSLTRKSKSNNGSADPDYEPDADQVKPQLARNNSRKRSGKFDMPPLEDGPLEEIVVD